MNVIAVIQESQAPENLTQNQKEVVKVNTCMSCYIQCSSNEDNVMRVRNMSWVMDWKWIIVRRQWEIFEEAVEDACGKLWAMCGGGCVKRLWEMYGGVCG